MDWSLRDVAAQSETPTQCFDDVETIVSIVSRVAEQGDHILIMSNGGFEGIHARMLNALTEVYS
jgi:UDP-N-acetylmuramate: L-alanyl-gamma-D-glutamyl-meso-diaminopimelate ligase